MSLTQFEDQLCHRLIPSKYPPIGLYDDVSDPSQLEAIFIIESLTNPRLAEDAGDFSIVPVDERLVGIPFCSYVMAAFTHVNPDGARFSTQDFGAYYASEHRHTAVKETVYHMSRIMAYTNEPAQEIQMRAIEARFTGQLFDVRGDEYKENAIYDSHCYSASQELAEHHKQKKSDGIAYRSVRHNGLSCFALFKPNLVNKICPSGHYSYRWDGEKIDVIMELNQISLDD